MRVAVTGATGLAGYPIAAHLAGLGHDIITLGRRPASADWEHVNWALGDRPRLVCDALVHCAFDHVPGRYRGGEGDDPERFLRLNGDGSRHLFDGMGDARIVFLSSRAVYGDRPGTTLVEDMLPLPDTLYGRLKLATEGEVASRRGVSLRATGIYGPPPPGRDHKWAGLFADFAAGRSIAPRVATEVHGDDLGAAVALALDRDIPEVLNVSDILLDRRDLLATYAAVSGRTGHLPPPGDPVSVSAMDCGRLHTMGWTPRGLHGLSDAIRMMIR